MSEQTTLGLDEVLSLLDDLDGKVDERTDEEQVRRLKQAADLPDGYDAQYALALRYWFGRGVPQDNTEAFRLCSMAAEGLPEARYTLGYRHFYGEGVRQDHATALKLLEGVPANSTANESDRLLLIGWMYETGSGTEQQLDKAAHCYREAAADGNPEAQYRYAYMLNAGEGVPTDLTGAFQFARESAENGFTLGKTLLASMLLNGIEEISVAADEDEAVRLIQEAVEEDEPIAFFLLGYCYESGRGFGKIDFVQAAENYRKAAAGGHPPASDRLDKMYRKGTAVREESERPQDA